LFLYCVSIFLGAFLLFLVQPMMAQFILPWFGGSSLVWTTCMLFFQSGLVLGYAYAHQVTQRFSPTTQWLLHVIVLSVAVLFLPIRPGLEWKPIDGLNPSWRVLVLLGVTIGVPYVVLSTTGPLIQRWQSLSHPQHSPYRLFALSNLGSLLALVAFPFAIESYWTLDQQSWYWSGGLLLYAVLVGVCGYRYQRLAVREVGANVVAKEAPSQGDVSQRARSLTGLGRWVTVLWFLLPMLASVQLLATTNFLTQEVGSHPFLWILPLALYLISFIVCFESDRLYVRPLFFLTLCGSAIYACYVYDKGLHETFRAQVVAYSSVLFSAAMICHGELARLKPDPSRLTAFYLWISLGGAAGGMLVALIAPHVFRDYFEFHLSLILIVVLTLPLIVVDGLRHYFSRPRPAGKLVGDFLSLIAGIAALSGVAIKGIEMVRFSTHANVVGQYRNEYGVLKVQDNYGKRTLSHGKTMHGYQLSDPEWEHRPTSYYNPESGLGIVMRFLQGELSGGPGSLGAPVEKAVPPLRIGVIGLGTGTAVTWGRQGDWVRFFEIDPKVVMVARSHFTYLSGAQAQNDIVLGDARIQLERENDLQEPPYDALIADAFSSDSIPKHLLTTEALKVFLQRIKPDGFLVIHVSNRFIELAPLLERQARDLGVPAIYLNFYQPEDEPEAFYQGSSSWVVFTRNEVFPVHPVVQSSQRNFPTQQTEVRWTDDFSPLLPLIRQEQLYGPNADD
jgi:hypothetical protein